MLDAASKTFSSSGQPPFTTSVSIPLFWRRHFSSSSVPALNSCWPAPWLGLPATSTILVGEAAKAAAADSRISVLNPHLTSNIQHLSFHAQQPRRVVVVDLAQTRLSQFQAGDAPPAREPLLVRR